MFASKDLFLTRPSGYQISRSVRLRSSASAYFNRTPASAGNRKTWTWSGWVKLGSLSTTLNLMYAYSADSDSGLCQLSFQSNQLRIQGFSASFLMVSTPIYRDPSAWYHIVYKVDTTQATAADRVRVYVNGVQITAWATNTPPPQNTDTAVNNNVAHNIGRNTRNSNDYLDGYLTEINLIDGQALDPSYFGETNAVTGVWQPKRYAGTYGTNGFYLNFSDNSGVTATTIGKDYSGNGNNWTPSAGISITAGVTYDSMLDVPTLYADGGNGRGNYAVLNPLRKGTDNVVADANLKSTHTSTIFDELTTASIAVSSGKWYFEGIPDLSTNKGSNIGILEVSVPVGANSTAYQSSGFYAYSVTAGTKFNNNTSSAYGAACATGDVIGVALDLDSGTLAFYKNGVSQGTAFTGITGTFAPAVHTWNSQFWTLNFGQRPFTYTPPTGFVALNTQNLPTPTISKGNVYFDATTYTGNGSTQNIVNSGGFQPDLVWAKIRSAVENHRLYDSVRGIALPLFSNLTNAETSEPNSLTAFNSNGFALGPAGSSNTNAATYVGWQWNAGGSTVTNTSGSISAQVRANATAGFSVVTFTAQTSGTGTVGHGLGVAPRFTIFKSRGGTGNWHSYHASIGANNDIFLNLTNAATASANIWANTAPTSSVITLGTDFATSGTWVAYCFAAVAGYSAFGSYTGNGSADGPFVYLGFRPRFLMVKNASAVGNWLMFDSSRDLNNQTVLFTFANTSDAEQNSSATVSFDFLSNGFKVRNTSGNINGSGNTLIYMAFAENPFKLSLAR